MGLRRQMGLCMMWVALGMSGFPLTIVAQGAPKAASAPRLPAPVTVATTASVQGSTAEGSETQQQLLGLLQVSPSLAGVLANDPSLLANSDYITRTDPDLAAFLTQHPEVTRNPAFYLFSDLRNDRHPGQYRPLEQREGITRRTDRPRSGFDELMSNMAPVLAITAFSVAVVLLARLLLNNRRWSKAFRLQSEVHGQLISRFGSSEELMEYMRTDAGKRFLEAAPIAVDEPGGRLPNVVSRVLLNAQIGVVMLLLGLGMIMVRNYTHEGRSALLILGVLVLMPGLGFILSAAMTLTLARRLGLMAPGTDTGSDAAGQR